MSKYNIITGAQLPEQVIVAIVDEDAHRGVIGKNPFCFKDYDISEDGVHEPQALYELNKNDEDNFYMCI